MVVEIAHPPDFVVMPEIQHPFDDVSGVLLQVYVLRFGVPEERLSKLHGCIISYSEEFYGVPLSTKAVTKPYCAWTPGSDVTVYEKSHERGPHPQNK